MPNLTPIVKENHDHGDMGSDTHYPYGTELDFRDKMVDSLGISELEVGAEVTIIATATLTSKSESSHQALGDAGADDSQSMSFQLTGVQIEPSVTPENLLKKLYPGE